MSEWTRRTKTSTERGDMRDKGKETAAQMLDTHDGLGHLVRHDSFDLQAFFSLERGKEGRMR
jgi:hypothetical protein